MHGFLGQRGSPSSGILISAAVSGQHISVTNPQTDRQTDTQTMLCVCHICHKRLHLCYACNVA